MKDSPGGRLYYRVLPVDTHGANGAAVTGSFTLPKVMRVSVGGFLVRGQPASVTINATDVAGHAVRFGKVTITGAGLRTKRVKLNKRGRRNVTLKPRRRGNVTVVVRHKGYVDGSALVGVA